LRRFAPDYDNTQTFADLKRVQALLKRLNRANTIIMKLDDPQRAHAVADEVEHRYGYKSVSWQEANEDLMSTLTTRNIIMYTVVSAVLVVAAFGIYNVISTVVLEKQRDIAILKSMGFRARDIRRTFLVQGVLLGLAGSALGLPFGAGLMLGLMQIRLKFPGSSDPVPLPIDWNWPQFAIAAASLWVLPSAPACCRRARRRACSRWTFCAAHSDRDGHRDGKADPASRWRSHRDLGGGCHSRGAPRRVCRDHRRVGLR
jgi:ABC-type lipoprotein release transport system permease subunit